MSARRDGGSWRSLLPVEAALDPMDISLVSVGAGRLSFEVYIEEPDPDLSTYGLDDPEMRIELKGAGGAVEVLNFSRPGVDQPWFCMRDGSVDVFKLSSRDAVLLTYPFEAMIDLRLARVDPADIDAVRLERPGGDIRLERAGEGWVVSVNYILYFYCVNTSFTIVCYYSTIIFPSKIYWNCNTKDR